MAATSAPAFALSSPSLSRAVGAAGGDSPGPAWPALLLPGGGRGGCGGGGLEAAEALGRAEHRGSSRRGSGRPCVLPTVRGPQGRLRVGTRPRAPLGELGLGTGGPAPRPGSDSHPGGGCQGNGRCVSACARWGCPEGDAGRWGPQVFYLRSRKGGVTVILGALGTVGHCDTGHRRLWHCERCGRRWGPSASETET